MPTVPQTNTRAWDYYSGVSDCDTCDGRGTVNYFTWSELCSDCGGEPVIPCPVCGFDEHVTGRDCIVCEMVHDLSPANMQRINPADLADCFAAAVNAALNHRGEA